MESPALEHPIEKKREIHTHPLAGMASRQKDTVKTSAAHRASHPYHHIPYASTLQHMIYEGLVATYGKEEATTQQEIPRGKPPKKKKSSLARDPLSAAKKRPSPHHTDPYTWVSSVPPWKGKPPPTTLSHPYAPFTRCAKASTAAYNWPPTVLSCASISPYLQPVAAPAPRSMLVPSRPCGNRRGRAGRGQKQIAKEEGRDQRGEETVHAGRPQPSSHNGRKHVASPSPTPPPRAPPEHTRAGRRHAYPTTTIPPSWPTRPETRPPSPPPSSSSFLSSTGSLSFSSNASVKIGKGKTHRRRRDPNAAAVVAPILASDVSPQEKRRIPRPAFNPAEEDASWPTPTAPPPPLSFPLPEPPTTSRSSSNGSERRLSTFERVRRSTHHDRRGKREQKTTSIDNRKTPPREAEGKERNEKEWPTTTTTARHALAHPGERRRTSSSTFQWDHRAAEEERENKMKHEGGNRFFILEETPPRKTATHTAMAVVQDALSPPVVTASHIPYGTLSIAEKTASPPPSTSSFVVSSSHMHPPKEKSKREKVRWMQKKAMARKWSSVESRPPSATHPLRRDLSEGHGRGRGGSSAAVAPPPHGAPLTCVATSPMGAGRHGSRAMPSFLSRWLAAAGLSMTMAWEKSVLYQSYLAKPFSSQSVRRWTRACAASQRCLQHLLPVLATFPMDGEKGTTGVRKGSSTVVPSPSRRRGAAMTLSGPFSPPTRESRGHTNENGEKDRSKREPNEPLTTYAHLPNEKEKKKGDRRGTSSSLLGYDAAVSLGPSSSLLRPQKRVAQERVCRAKLLEYLQKASHWGRVWGEVPMQEVALVIDGRFVLPSKLHVEANATSLKQFCRRGFRLREVLLKYLGMDHIGTPVEEMKSPSEEQKEREGSYCSSSSRSSMGSGGGGGGSGYWVRESSTMDTSAKESSMPRMRHPQGLAPSVRPTMHASGSSFLAPSGKDAIENERRRRKGKVDDAENASLVVIEHPTISPALSSRDVLLDVKLDITTGLLRVRFQVLITTDTQELSTHGEHQMDTKEGEEELEKEEDDEWVELEKEEEDKCRSSPAEKGGKRRPHRNREVNTTVWEVASSSSSTVSSPASGSVLHSPHEARRPVVVEKRISQAFVLGTWTAASLGPSMRWILLDGPLQHQILFFDTPSPDRSGVAADGEARTQMGTTSRISHVPLWKKRMCSSATPHRPFCPTSSGTSSHSTLQEAHSSSSSSPSTHTGSKASMVLLGTDGVCFPRMHPCDQQATHLLCYECGQWFCVQQKPPSCFSIRPPLAPRFSPAKGGRDVPASLSTWKDLPHQCATGHRSALDLLLPVSPSFLQAAVQFLEDVQRREKQYHTSIATVPRGSTLRRHTGKHPSPMRAMDMSEETKTLPVLGVFDPAVTHTSRLEPKTTLLDTFTAQDAIAAATVEAYPTRSPTPPPQPGHANVAQEKANANDSSRITFSYLAESQRIARAKRVRFYVKEFVNAHRVEAEWHPLWGRMVKRSVWQK